MNNPAPIVVAHRGLHQQHPENSLSAFQAAWAAGVGWVELDVRRSKDFRAIVLHDETLDRTTNGSGPCAQVGWAEIYALRLKDAAGKVTAEPIPLLEEVIAAMPPEAGALVEIKSSGPGDERLTQEVARLLARRRALIISFDDSILAEAGAQIGKLFDEKAINRDILHGDGPVFLHHSLVRAHLIQELNLRRKLWGAWTVNDRQTLEKILPLGPRFIISDDPMAIGSMIG
jgi:glycerophosphoryl diester phosphodiesterase